MCMLCCAHIFSHNHDAMKIFTFATNCLTDHRSALHNLTHFAMSASLEASTENTHHCIRIHTNFPLLSLLCALIRREITFQKV